MGRYGLYHNAVVLTEKDANRVNISSNERGDNINVSIAIVVHV